MILAALLPLADIHRVRNAIPHGRVVTFAGYKDLCQALKNGSYDSLVIDTALVGTDCTEIIRCIKSTHLPVLVYIEANPRSIALFLELLPAGVSQVVLRGIDDSETMLARALGELPLRNLGIDFLYSFRPNLSRVPVHLRAALIEVFSTRPVPSPKALAATAGATRRSIDRWLSDAGLRPISWFISLARLLSALPLLVAGESISLAVQASGFGSRRTFERLTTELTGLSVSQLVLRFVAAPEEVTRDLAARSIRHPSY
jgi:AraC-like DNA-binding protein